MSSPALAVDLRCEYHVNPVGIDEPKPRLSWRLQDDRRGARQTAYRLLVASSREKLEAGEADVWDSGEVESDRTVHVAYDGPALKSRRRTWWKVQARDADGERTVWSDPAFWEMGLLDRNAWQAQWISLPPRDAGFGRPCPLLCKTFDLPAEPTRARVYVTARGLFELHLNGKRIGEDMLAPGWTNQLRRNQVLTYDITDLLAAGQNTLDAALGDGWYCGRIAKPWSEDDPLGTQPQLLAQLEIDTAGGETVTVVTDNTWQATTGPILASDIYDGETFDARIKPTDWRPAHVFEDRGEAMDAKVCEPVRKIQELTPRAVTEPKPGVHVFDLGQNMVGWARLKITAEAGTAVSLRFAEMLNDDGTLYTANLRSAKATDLYICRGGGQEVWEPRFTFHGFRYVELTGPDAQPSPDAVTGVVLHNDMERIGSFHCSHDKLNQLQSNIVWGQKGNFLEVPTDCPQRDERLGWTGDAQVFVPTACFNYNVAPFFTKWQRDLADEQSPTGAIPPYAPSRLPSNEDDRDGGPAWADAVVVCPWTVYQRFGDERLLARHYDELRKFIDHMEKNAADLIRGDAHRGGHGGYGDWLAMDAPAGQCPGATPRDVIGTAYFAYSTDLVARIARRLGKDDDAHALEALRARIVQAFRRDFVTATGRVLGDTQTSYALALAFDLLPEALRPAAIDRLVGMLEQRKWRLSTGFVGTPLLCPVLTRFGRADVAYKLLLQDEYPSWLYTVEQGATTMWERWNSYTKKDGFGPVGMNSFNHYAYGAIGDWMYAAVAGLATDPDAPGYKRLAIAPVLGEGLTSADATLRTLHGEARSAWAVADGAITLDITVPPNTTAAVTLPNAAADAVTESGGSLAQAEGISDIASSGSDLTLAAAAGRYTFTWPLAT